MNLTSPIYEPSPTPEEKASVERSVEKAKRKHKKKHRNRMRIIRVKKSIQGLFNAAAYTLNNL